MQGCSRFAYDVLLQLVQSVSSRWGIALQAQETKSFRALVVAFLSMMRTASALMRSHSLAKGLVYGTGILIVIDALDAIAQVPCCPTNVDICSLCLPAPPPQGSNDILHVLTEMFPPNVRVMCTCRCILLWFALCFGSVVFWFLYCVHRIDQALGHRATRAPRAEAC
jgi:hypothetical protein